MTHPLQSGSLGLRDPWPQGIGLIRELWTRWSHLDITHVGSLIAIAGALPTGARFLARIWREVHGCIRRFFLASVTIPGGDPLNRSVVQWMQAYKPRHHRSFTGRTQVNNSAHDRAAALKKAQHPVLYAPHWNSRWFLHEGSIFVITRAESYTSNDPNYDGIGGEQITVGRLGWSVEPVKKLIRQCRAYSERQTQFFVIIYSRDRYGVSWKPKSRAPIRHLDTVHFDSKVKQELVSDIRSYLDPRTQKRYQSRSMPYRRGYLFYGPPGTGKSSLSVAIAGEFGLDLYEVKIPTVPSDADLEQMFQEIPPRSIVLLEDIDAVWTKRSSNEKHEQDTPGSCTLSGLLNVLDGVGSQEGRIVIMTTNRPSELDDALIRPGRVDMKVLLGNISQASAKEMFVRMFSPDLGACNIGADDLHDLAMQFARFIPDDTFTPSLLQGFFQHHLDSPRNAVSSIEAWVRQELAKKHDFEFVRKPVDGTSKVRMNGTFSNGTCPNGSYTNGAAYDS